MSVRKLAAAASLGLAGVAAYLCFWPVPIEPVSWPAPTPPGVTGPYVPNTRLANLRTIDIGAEIGPEHIAIGPDRKLYAAMEGGTLLRMDPDGGKQEVFAKNGRAGPWIRLRRRRTNDRGGPHEGPARHRA